MPDEKLKPCPFCGEEDQEVLEAYDGSGKGDWLVTCGTCRADGPVVIGKSNFQAIKLWNKREPSDA